jgi:hypothetical protein
MASQRANQGEEIAPWRYTNEQAKDSCRSGCSGSGCVRVYVFFIRYRARTRRSLFALLFRLVGAGEFVLTRKTLLGIKQRAERASVSVQ